MTHDLIALNFLKTQFSQTTNSGTSKHEFLPHYMITYESCFTGKVNTYSCERTMKEYVHGLFTTEVEINWTSACTQLFFVESICKNFIVTDGTNSYCNGGLHSLFTSGSGLRSVFWTLLWSRNAAVTTWLHLLQLSRVTLYARTATDGNVSVVEKGFFAVATYWR